MMKKSSMIICGTLGLMACILGACASEEHVHTFTDTYATSGAYHWHTATCEHTQETKDKAKHDFDEGQTQENGDTIYTCKVCGYEKTKEAQSQEHKHAFADTWQTDENEHWRLATCEHTEEIGDREEHDFNAGEEQENYDIKYTCKVCGYVDTVELLERVFNVSGIPEFQAETEIQVEGYYAGVAEDGPNGAREVLLKDVNNDTLLAVRNVPEIGEHSYGYEKGDKIRLYATVKTSSSEHTPNKKYLEYSNSNESVENTVVSKNNAVSYELNDAIEITSWEEMKAHFTLGTIEQYSYFKISGKLYMNAYTGGDGQIAHRTHMNETGTTLAKIRTDDARTVSLRDSVMTKNLGDNWEELFFDETNDSFPGVETKRTFYAVYTGGNSDYYQLTIMEKDWIEEFNNPLEKKKVIFIGNSYTYYGQSVLGGDITRLTQEARSNDKGFFYQICHDNGVDVEVTNWAFSSHSLPNLFGGNCTAGAGCDGVDHASYLTDRAFDYVVIQPGSSATSDKNFLNDLAVIMDFFKTANPNTKFVVLIPYNAYGVIAKNPLLQTNILNNLKTLANQGVTIVDWGGLVMDILNGAVSVPNSNLVYEKNTFVVAQSAIDGYHPNVLSGYITSLMTYCAITGQEAEGKPYSFCNDSTRKPSGFSKYMYNFSNFISQYYKVGATNFDSVFASPTDMKGIQSLIDKHLKNKAYMNYNYTNS